MMTWNGSKKKSRDHRVVGVVAIFVICMILFANEAVASQYPFCKPNETTFSFLFDDGNQIKIIIKENLDDDSCGSGNKKLNYMYPESISIHYSGLTVEVPNSCFSEMKLDPRSVLVSVDPAGILVSISEKSRQNADWYGILIYPNQEMACIRRQPK